MVEASIRKNTLEYFQVGGLRLAGKRWRNANGLPVLALHGWLDNCASFDALAAHMPDTDWLSVDCAGHGQSDHRAHIGAYTVWQDVPEILAVADQIDWPQFHLVGHSRGAMIAFLIAATFPERVLSLHLLEGVAPMIEPPELAVQRLRDSVLKTKVASARHVSYYSDFDKAVQARCRGLFPLSVHDSEVLARHGVRQDRQGYYWHYDAKLTAPSETRYSEAQVTEFAKRISSPTQLILAKEGIILQDKHVMAWLSKQSFYEQYVLPGDHHFHMSAQCEAVAACLNKSMHSAKAGASSL